MNIKSQIGIEEAPVQQTDILRRTGEGIVSTEESKPIKIEADSTGMRFTASTTGFRVLDSAVDVV